MESVSHEEMVSRLEMAGESLIMGLGFGIKITDVYKGANFFIPLEFELISRCLKKNITGKELEYLISDEDYREFDRWELVRRHARYGVDYFNGANEKCFVAKNIRNGNSQIFRKTNMPFFFVDNHL